MSLKGAKEMIEELKHMLIKPAIFTKSKEAFWDDEYMSKRFLEAHLNPDWDAASRKHLTIEKSVEWIGGLNEKKSKILDLGCGPGLYANQLAEKGNDVIGIDLSKRSINYAKKTAQDKNLNTKFIQQNYLEINYQEEFDVIILIYCDLGVLTNTDRDILLDKIYKALKPSGLFIFDVFSFSFEMDLLHKFSYEVENEGFFTKENHLELKQTFYYPDMQTYLDQYTIITKNKTYQHRVYKQLYDRVKLMKILPRYKEVIFKADITGVDFQKDSETIAVVARK